MDAPVPVEPVAPAAHLRKPRYGDVLEAELTHIDARGRVVGSSGEYKVLLRRGTPGARVRVEVIHRKRDRVEARVLETLRASPDAALPRCAHFGACGGCSFQDLVYAAQLD